ALIADDAMSAVRHIDQKCSLGIRAAFISLRTAQNQNMFMPRMFVRRNDRTGLIAQQRAEASLWRSVDRKNIDAFVKVLPLQRRIIRIQTRYIAPDHMLHR